MLKLEQTRQVVEELMNDMHQGIVFVDGQERIQLCNRVAKQNTGIVVDAPASHAEGKIEEGDIVLLADNRLGGDDGNLGNQELALLNIQDKSIEKGGLLLAVGVYKNKKITPKYKYLPRLDLDVPFRLETNYLGFDMVLYIDQEKKEIGIRVSGITYLMHYFFTVGNMVVLDGHTGKVKFFQAKGYSVRNEDVGNLLRGGRFQAKAKGYVDVDVTGAHFLDLFDESELSTMLSKVLRGKEEPVRGRLYAINRRPFICSIMPMRNEGKVAGVFLTMQDASYMSELIQERNEMIQQMEMAARAVESQAGEALPEGAFEGFIGEGRKMQTVKYMACRASKHRFNVIITGESGTGKSKLAREIHRLGSPDAPFVEVNCNAIAPSLLESELFGYVGGAFTGAKSEGKVGFFEAANHGTIFLDEIGEIPMEIQVKLLHVLQDKVIYRVGSSKPIKIDVRVIGATNRNLEEEVGAGRFRQDLYYRINVFPIEMPPIRERTEDLYLLINAILKQSCEEFGMESKQFSGEALKQMISYNWPGNVRELENVIERAITLCDSNLIYSEHLSIAKSQVPQTMKEKLSHEEARILEVTLMKHMGDKQKAMEELDLSRSVFYDKLKKYHIK